MEKPLQVPKVYLYKYCQKMVQLHFMSSEAETQSQTRKKTESGLLNTLHPSWSTNC